MVQNKLLFYCFTSPIKKVRYSRTQSSIQYSIGNHPKEDLVNTFLWILQGMLAIVFMMTGIMKVVQKKEAMADKMGFVEDFSQMQVTGIGVLEIMGAMGVILPWATGILPWLTPLAAVGLAFTMIGAFLTHLRRKELIPMGIVNIVLFSMAVLVAIGRF